MHISVFLLLILTSCVTSDDADMTSRRLNRRKFLELQRASEQHARRERLRYTTCTSAEEQPQHQLHDNHDASKRKRRSVALDDDVMRRSDDVSMLFTEEAGIVEYDLSRLTSRLPAKNLTVEVWVKAEGGQQNPTNIFGTVRVKPYIFHACAAFIFIFCSI